jgi:feruloyl esterase
VISTSVLNTHYLDGVVAGAPAFAFNSLQSWSGNFLNITGPPGSPSFITQNVWATTIQNDVLKQCDALDGLADGLLEDPTMCKYDPSGLLCGGTSANSTGCLTKAQVETVRRVYEPLVYPNGTLIYPRMYAFLLSHSLSSIFPSMN